MFSIYGLLRKIQYMDYWEKFSEMPLPKKKIFIAT